MTLLTFGINHNLAPVDIREQVVFVPDKINSALVDILELRIVSEAAILSTCNRTEIYCETTNVEDVMSWFANYHKINLKTIKQYTFKYTDLDAVRHILRVASGLDSLVLGEPQILGQMKGAYNLALNAGSLGKKLNRLFQHTFKVAKQIRTDTAIGSSPVSVAFAAVSLSKQIFGDISDKTVMLIGAGETIELTSKHLAENGIGQMIIVNRSLDKANNLSKLYNGYAIGLTDISSHLHKADIVISSTASPLPVIGKGTVESALKKRKHKPLFMVDIAVPRDIEAEVNELNNVFLYTVDDLQDVIVQNMKSRKNAAKQAEKIVDVQVLCFDEWFKSQRSISTIQSYRKQANEIRQGLLDKALKSLESGQAPEDVLEVFAHRLTNQLLHAPCSQLRQSKSEEQKVLIKAAQTLFDIKNS